MKCPFCQHDEIHVLDTRVSEEGDAIKRRRRCGKCDKRFTTFERIELSMPFVVKKNGSRVEYARTKLRGSLALALRKRPVAAASVDTAVLSIEEKLLTSGKREVDSNHIGELVMQELKRLDTVAYIRFASVYKNFEDLAEFQDAIEEAGHKRKE